MEEKWKDVYGYEGLYQISSQGRVHNKKWGRPVKPSVNKGNGYYEVHLYKNSKRTHFTIHRLVATHFIPLINGSDFVNHKDSDKHNNNYENLEWVTKSENGFHAGRAGLISVNLRKRVDQFSLSGEYIKTYQSVTEAASEVGGHKSNISACCRGHKKQSSGYLWKFSKAV